MSEIYLHVGTIKTGTTFLQMDVFPKVKNLQYYHMINLRTALVISSKTKFSNNKILISDEIFTGFHIEMHGPEFRIKMFNILKLLFPDAKIIVTFREQESFLKSAHNQAYKQRKYHKTLDEFKKEVHPDWYNRELIEKQLRERWSDIFILEYDELCINHMSYVKKICDYMNVEIPKYVNNRRNKSVELPKEMDK